MQEGSWLPLRDNVAAYAIAEWNLEHTGEGAMVTFDMRIPDGALWSVAGGGSWPAWSVVGAR